MTVALCTAVTVLRPLARAYSNARRATRRDAEIEIGLIDRPTSSASRLPSLDAMRSRSAAASGDECAYSIPA
jgi:hypothetical protein